MKQPCDRILHHAKVYTADALVPVVEAIAIKEGRIVAVGGDDDILRAFSTSEPAKDVVDLHGAFVYPGFVDAHCHLEPYGESLFEAELTGCISAADMAARVRAFGAAHPQGEDGTRTHWLLGRGWDQNLWQGRAMPDKTLLDALFPNRPVFLRRVDLHAAVANSMALRLAGITADTRIEGGEIALGADGQPTGLLVDEAQTPVRKLIPNANKDDRRQYILAAEKDCFRYGLTGVGDAYLDLPQVQLFDALHRSGAMKLRVNGMIPATEANLDFFLEKKSLRQHDYRTTDRLRLNSFKLFSDGAFGSRGAWLLAPYTDKPDTTGLALLDRAEALHAAKRICKAGKQLCTHAIGDAANRFVLGLYAEVLGGHNDLRWRIEHAQLVHPDDMRLFAENDVLPSIQPTHPTSDMKWLHERLGAERLAYSCGMQRLLRTVGRISLGSDFPVEGVNPLLGFYAAVTRQDAAGNPPEGFMPQERLTREQALLGTTLWNAWAEHRDHELGSIVAGKIADLTVLDTDIMVCPPQNIPSAKVLRTIVSGQEVFVA